MKLVTARPGSRAETVLVDALIQIPPEWPVRIGTALAVSSPYTLSPPQPINSKPRQRCFTLSGIVNLILPHPHREVIGLIEVVEAGVVAVHRQCFREHSNTLENRRRVQRSKHCLPRVSFHFIDTPHQISAVVRAAGFADETSTFVPVCTMKQFSP